MHEKVKNLSKLKRCSSNGYFKGKDGSIFIDREEIIIRWEGYIGQLYDDEDKESKSFPRQWRIGQRLSPFQ